MKVYQAISAVQKGLSAVGIAKERVTQAQGRYKYRGIDDVYAALSTLLPEHGLCILPRMIEKTTAERTGSGGGAVFYTTIKVDFDLVSTEDGSVHTVSAYGEAMDSGDKSCGKAMSYAYKSMAFMVFSIPIDGQDNDPDQHGHTVQPVDNGLPWLDISMETAWKNAKIAYKRDNNFDAILKRFRVSSAMMNQIKKEVLEDEFSEA